MLHINILLNINNKTLGIGITIVICKPEMWSSKSVNNLLSAIQAFSCTVNVCT